MSDTAPELIIEQQGSAGLLTLNRPKALNALTLSMVREMMPVLRAWADDPSIDRVVIDSAGEKAFCAGGDIRALYDWGKAGHPNAVGFYREEYQLNTLIKHYPKPYIALMDGITMGGGVGVSVHGSHRVATERLTFAMPETGIGLFPDVGGTYFLPRAPGRIGMYLGLTGARLKAADAVYCGIADTFVPSGNLVALRDALASGDDVGETISTFSEAADDAPVVELQDRIDNAFSKHSVEMILTELQNSSDEWSAKTASIIGSKSPTSLKIAFRQISEGASLDFNDCMRLEYRLVNRIMTGHDFYEGTRAVVIDKDQAPKWEPAELEQVTEEDVNRYFETLDKELEI